MARPTITWLHEDDEEEDDWIWEDEEEKEAALVKMDLYTAASVGDSVAMTNALKILPNSLNTPNKGGWTALMYAAYYGHSSILSHLHQCGASHNIRTGAGDTALMLASMCGHHEVVALLLQCSSVMDACNNKGWTAVFHAVHSRHNIVLRTLVSYGAQPSPREPGTGQTPLLLACRLGAVDCVQELLAAGADPTQQDSAGTSPYAAAQQAGATAVMDTIAEAVATRGILSARFNRSAFSDQQCSRLTRGERSSLLVLLKGAGLASYCDLFEQQDISLAVFLTLTDQDLKECGISKLGPRRKITSLIAHCQKRTPSIHEEDNAYASKLEAEMDELAVKHSEALKEICALQKMITREKQLRTRTVSLAADDRTRLQLYHHTCTAVATTLGLVYRDIVTAGAQVDNATAGDHEDKDVATASNHDDSITASDHEDKDSATAGAHDDTAIAGDHDDKDVATSGAHVDSVTASDHEDKDSATVSWSVHGCGSARRCKNREGVTEPRVGGWIAEGDEDRSGEGGEFRRGEGGESYDGIGSCASRMGFGDVSEYISRSCERISSGRSSDGISISTSDSNGYCSDNGYRVHYDGDCNVSNSIVNGDALYNDLLDRPIKDESVGSVQRFSYKVEERRDDDIGYMISNDCDDYKLKYSESKVILFSEDNVFICGAYENECSQYYQNIVNEGRIRNNFKDERNLNNKLTNFNIEREVACNAIFNDNNNYGKYFPHIYTHINYNNNGEIYMLNNNIKHSNETTIHSNNKDALTCDALAEQMHKLDLDKVNISSEKLIPLDKANIALDETCIPLNEANIPLNEANIPMNEANIPMNEANIGLKKVSITFGEVNIASEDATAAAAKVCIPCNYKSVPPLLNIPRLGEPIQECLRLLHKLLMLSDAAPSCPSK